jgi:hypothetical protein
MNYGEIYQQSTGKQWDGDIIYHLVMTNIAMENGP